MLDEEDGKSEECTPSDYLTSYTVIYIGVQATQDWVVRREMSVGSIIKAD
jgi:hypothetical protein